MISIILFYVAGFIYIIFINTGEEAREAPPSPAGIEEKDDKEVAIDNIRKVSAPKVSYSFSLLKLLSFRFFYTSSVIVLFFSRTLKGI